MLAKAGCQVPTTSAQLFADSQGVWGHPTASWWSAAVGQTRTPEGPRPLPAPAKSRSYCHWKSAVMAPLLPLETLVPATGQVMGCCTGDQGPGIRSLQLVLPHSGRLFVMSEPCSAPHCPAWAWPPAASGCSPDRARAWLHGRRSPGSGITSQSHFLAFAFSCAAALAFQRRGPQAKGAWQEAPGVPRSWKT